MLEYITLTNFQAWKALRVDFGPHVTTIVSSLNDVGKTSVLRALDWLTTNRGRVKSYLRLGSSFVRVEIGIDGHKVVRKVGKENVYLLDGRKFKAFKARVPEPIQKVLNIGEANFQGQLDSPYWFLESPGQVSRNLNKIVNLDIIDLALSNADSEVREAKKEHDQIKTRLDKARAERDELSWVRGANAEFGCVKMTQAQLDRVKEGLDTLKTLKSSLDENNTARIEALEKYRKLKKLVELARKVRRRDRDAKELSRLVEQIRECERVIEAGVPDMRKINSAMQRVLAARKNLNKLERLLADIRKAEECICVLKERSSQLEQDLKEKSGGLCPVCGRKLPNT